MENGVDELSLAIVTPSVEEVDMERITQTDMEFMWMWSMETSSIVCVLLAHVVGILLFVILMTMIHVTNSPFVLQNRNFEC